MDRGALNDLFFKVSGSPELLYRQRKVYCYLSALTVILKVTGESCRGWLTFLEFVSSLSSMHPYISQTWPLVLTSELRGLLCRTPSWKTNFKKTLSVKLCVLHLIFSVLNTTRLTSVGSRPLGCGFCELPCLRCLSRRPTKKKPSSTCWRMTNRLCPPI